MTNVNDTQWITGRRNGGVRASIPMSSVQRVEHLSGARNSVSVYTFDGHVFELRDPQIVETFEKAFAIE